MRKFRSERHTPTPENPVEVQSVGELVTDDENSGKYETPVVCSGKNLFDKNGSTEPGAINASSGISETNGWFFQTQLIKCSNIITLQATNGLGTSAYIRCFNHEKIFLGTVLQATNNAVINTIKLLPGTAYIQTCFRKNNFDSYQIELGSEATEYEPYCEPVRTSIFLDEPLRKIGDYVDYIDFENGRIVRNIGKKVFDGTEEFLPHSSLKGWFQSIDSTVLANKPAYCTHFSYINSAISVNAGQFTTTNTINNAGRHVFRMTSNTALEDFKTFLASEYEKGNPVTAYYPLAEQIIESIEFPEIPTFDGTTVVEANTEIQPSYMEITYKSRR